MSAAFAEPCSVVFGFAGDPVNVTCAPPLVEASSRATASGNVRSNVSASQLTMSRVSPSGAVAR